MDFQKAKNIKEMVVSHSRSGNLALYAEAQAQSVSLSELLEQLDPTPAGGQLDAFERQLYLAGISNEPKKSITMENFFVGGG